MDPKMYGEVGGHLIFTKQTRPYTAVMLNFDVQAVCEAPTVQAAVKLWNPSIKTTPAKKAKRPNIQSPRTPKE